MTTRLSVTATPGPERSFSPKGVSGAKPSGQITALSATGTPGGIRTFAPKTVAGGKPSDQVTTLSPLGTPGKVWSFEPKATASDAADQVTALSVIAVPGLPLVFVAKDAATIEPVPEVVAGGGGSKSKGRDDWANTRLGRQIIREDEEILAVVMAAVRTLH